MIRRLRYQIYPQKPAWQRQSWPRIHYCRLLCLRWCSLPALLPSSSPTPSPLSPLLFADSSPRFASFHPWCSFSSIPVAMAPTNPDHTSQSASLQYLEGPCWVHNKSGDNQKSNLAQINNMEVLTSREKKMVIHWGYFTIDGLKVHRKWKGPAINYTRTRDATRDCPRLGSRMTTLVPPAKGGRRNLVAGTSEVPCVGFRVPAVFGWKEM